MKNEIVIIFLASPASPFNTAGPHFQQQGALLLSRFFCFTFSLSYQTRSLSFGAECLNVISVASWPQPAGDPGLLSLQNTRPN